jgi:hypothetical protein
MKVTRSQRIAFQLVARTPHTKGIDGGLLPTARTSDTKGGRILEEKNGKMVRVNKDKTQTYGANLSDLMETLLRTPSANPPGVKAERLSTKDGQPMKMGQRAYDKETGRLAQVVLEQQLAMLPTPTVNGNHNRAGLSEKSGDGLATRLAMLPTPQSRDFRSPDKPESGNFQRKVREGYTIDLNSTIAMTPTNGQSTGLKLQPAFAFWMMGYPEDWTLRPFLLEDPSEGKETPKNDLPLENGGGNPSKPPETPSCPK